MVAAQRTAKNDRWDKKGATFYGKDLYGRQKEEIWNFGGNVGCKHGSEETSAFEAEIGGHGGWVRFREGVGQIGPKVQVRPRQKIPLRKAGVEQILNQQSAVKLRKFEGPI